MIFIHKPYKELTSVHRQWIHSLLTRNIADYWEYKEGFPPCHESLNNLKRVFNEINSSSSTGSTLAVQGETPTLECEHYHFEQGVTQDDKGCNIGDNKCNTDDKECNVKGLTNNNSSYSNLEDKIVAVQPKVKEKLEELYKYMNEPSDYIFIMSGSSPIGFIKLKCDVLIEGYEEYEENLFVDFILLDRDSRGKGYSNKIYPYIEAVNLLYYKKPLIIGGVLNTNTRQAHIALREGYEQEGASGRKLTYTTRYYKVCNFNEGKDIMW